MTIHPAVFAACLLGMFLAGWLASEWLFRIGWEQIRRTEGFSELEAQLVEYVRRAEKRRAPGE